MTTDKRKVQLQAELDASGVRKGTDEVKRAVGDMARDVTQQGQAAAKSIEGIGEGSAKAAAKVEANTRSLVASIERATAAAKAGGHGTAQFYEVLANQRGVNAQALAPYIAQLREAQRAQEQATGGLNGMGLSAKATTAALRQVPAQFTDIIVSLQGGQAPLQVLLQQGGQLKDVFGGVGNAARALGGYVLGLVNPFTLAAAAAGVLAYGFVKGGSEATNYTRALALSGNAAGATAGQLSAVADAVSRLGGATQGRAAEVLTQMAASGNVGAINLQRFTAAAIELERVGGPAAEKTAEAFADLAKSPLQAAIKLNETTRFLTQSTYEQIKALEEQGRTQDAARVAQEAYAASIEQRAPQIRAQLGLVERAWEAIKDATKGAANAILNVGRGVTIMQQLVELQKQLTAAEASRDVGRNAGKRAATHDKEIAAIRQQIILLEKAAGYEATSAALEAQRASQVKAAIEFDKEGVQLLSKRERLEREITQARNQGAAAGKSQEEIEKRIAAIKERYKEAPGKQYFAELAADIRKATEAAQADIDAGGQMSAARRLQIELTSKLQDVMAKLTPAQRVAIQVQIDEVVALKAANEERAKALKIAEGIAKARNAAEQAALKGIDEYLQRERDAAAKSLQSVEKRIEALNAEEAAVALAKVANISLAEAVERVAIARLRERQAQYSEGSEPYLAVQREIAAREKLLTVIASSESRKANEKAAEDAAKAWQRATDQISEALTDALIRGGRSGWDYIKAYVRAQTLRPVVQAIAQPVAGSLQSAFGLPGLGQAASFGNVGNGFASLAGLPGRFGQSLAGGFEGLATSGLGQSFGLSSLVDLGTGVEAAVLSQTGAGISSALAAAGPYVAAAAVIYSIAKSLDKSGTPHLGSVVTADLSGVRTGGSDPSGILNNLNRQTDDALRLLAGSSVQTLNAISAAFGQKVGYSAQAKFTADGVDASFGGFEVRRDGARVAEIAGTVNNDAARYASDREAAFSAFGLDVAATVRQALDAIGLPDWARQQLDALGDSADLDKLTALAQTITQTQQGFAALQKELAPFGGTFAAVAGLSGDALYSLVQFAGGLDGLRAGIGSFYQEFYSQQERAVIESARLAETLGAVGLAVPATREAFRSLVEGQDLTTESGRKAYAALLGVSGAFAQLNPGIEQIAQGATDAASALRERQGLEVELLRLQGDTAALRARELAGLDESNRALQEQIYAQQDQAEAASLATDAILKARTAAAKTVADIEAGQQRLAASRAGLVASLQALQDYGQGIRNALAQTVQGIADVRAQALANVSSARDQLAGALDGIARVVEQSAQRVSAAQAAVQAATADRSAAAGAVAGFLSQLQQAADAASGGVARALDGIARVVEQGAQRVSAAQAAVQAAMADRSAAAGAVAGFLSQRQQAADAASGGVAAALASLRGRASDAQAPVGAAQQRITDAFVRAQETAASAQERLAGLQGKTADATSNLADVMARLSGSLSDYLLELTGASAGTAGAPGVNRALFLDVAGRAQAGDEQAAGQLVGLARQFSQASLAGSATGESFDADQRLIRQTLARVLGVAANAASATKPAAAVADNGAAIAAAQADVAAALAEVERLRAIAVEAGASLTATSVDLLGEWRAAQQAATAAQQTYLDAAAQASANGVLLGAQVGEFAGALAALIGARAELASTQQAVEAGGVDLTLADRRTELQRILDSYAATQTALEAAQGAQSAALAESAAATAALADAQLVAAAAGVSIGSTVDALAAQLAEFAGAMAALIGARAELSSTQQAVEAGGVDLTLADQRTELQRILDGYVAAQTALEAAQGAQSAALAESAAATAALADAQLVAAAAGVSIGSTADALAAQLEAFGVATRKLADEQAVAATIGADVAAGSRDLLGEYLKLEQQRMASLAALGEFDAAIAGVDFSPLQEGINGLGELMAAVTGSLQALTAAQQQVAAQPQTGRWTDIGGGVNVYLSRGGAVGIGRTGDPSFEISGIDGRTFGVGAVQEYVRQLFEAGDLSTIYREAVAFGIASEDLETLTGTGNAVLAWARAAGLPAFASGGLHSGGARLVGEYGPELEVTGPARYYDASQTRDMLSGGGSQVVAALHELADRIERIEQSRSADSRRSGQDLADVKASMRRMIDDGVRVYTNAGEPLAVV